MTNREFFEAIATANISADLTAKANDELAKLDARNARRAENSTSKHKMDIAPIIEGIKAMFLALTPADVRLTSEVATAVGVTTSKVSPILRDLVEGGYLVAVDVKVPKKGTQKGYHLA